MNIGYMQPCIRCGGTREETKIHSVVYVRKRERRKKGEVKAITTTLFTNDLEFEN